MSQEQTIKRESLTKGTMFSFSHKLFTILVGYTLNLFLARQLGPELFGFFGVIITIMMWLELVLAEGIPIWTVRLMAKDGPPALARVYISIQFAMGLALMLLLLALATPLAALFGEPESAGLLMIAAIDMPLFAIYMIVLAMMLGKQQYGRKLITSFSYTTGKLVAVLVLVMLGFGITGAVVGNVVSTVVGLVVGLVMVISLWGIRGLTTKKYIGTERGEAVRGTVTPAAFEVLRVLIVTLDLWVVKAVLPAASAGFYRAAQLVAAIPFFIAAGMGGAFYAAFNDAYAKGNIEKCKHYVSQASRLLITAGALWLAVMLPTADSLLALLFSDPYEAGGLVLMILGVGLAVAAATDMVGAVLLVLKRYRLLVGAALVAVLVEVVMVFWLVNVYGMTGVAMAVSTVFVTGGIVAYVFLRRFQRTSPLIILLRVVPASLAVGLTFYWVNPEPGLGLVGMYLVAPLLYALLLLPTGGLTRQDLRDFRSGLSRNK